MKSYIKIIAFIFVFALASFVFRYFELSQYLTLESLKSSQQSLHGLYQNDPTWLIAIYVLVYVTITSLSLPGATILTLAGGALFGLLHGTIIVSFASTLGATCAFLVSRFFLRDYVQSKFKDKLAGFNEGIKKEGAFYLFTLRLVPVFPFFLINLVMGLTPIKTRIFFIVSQLGMLPGTIAFVNAGTELSQITRLDGILSPNLLLSFTFIGLLPFLSKFLIGYLKARKVYAKYKKPKKFDYNLIAIGGGSAGLVSAYIAAAVKAKVALVEKHKMGGDCLNTGCVPSKALIKSAKVINLIKNSKKYGISSSETAFDFSQVMARVQRVIRKVEPHDSVERYRGLGVDCISGHARINSPWEVEVNGKRLTTRNIVIATGAKPFIPNIPGLEKIPYFTSDNIWSIDQKPGRLVVLGGGPIGCELSQAFARLGSQVVQIEKNSRIMAREDSDVSAAISEKFKSEGITVMTNTEAIEVKTESGKQFLVCKSPDGFQKVEFDQILLAIGRSANVTGFGLEDLGVEISPRGTIVVDDYLRTKYPNIFACGDVAGPYQFTHTASHMAWFCAVNALFGQFKKFKVDYRVIPWATFTDPEVARVGINESEAKEKGIDYEVFKYGLDDLDRAIADEEDHGFIKVLLKPNTDKILGVTIVGANAGEIIVEYVTAMKYNLGLNKILGTIHIYPTYGEANKYVAGVWKRETQPKKFLTYVEKFHKFMRVFVLLFLSLNMSSRAQAQVGSQPKNDPTKVASNDVRYKTKPVVVLMSIDGVRHDYPEMHQMKNLIEIAKMGTSAKGLIPVFPSKTFPNHYSIVTGLYPKNHRIIENNFYDPKMKKAYSPNDPFTVNDGKWYGGIPLWVLAEKQGLRSASYFWVGSEAEIQGKRPSYYYPFAPLSSNDAEIQQVLKWAQLPFEKRPGFITLYFPMVDNAGHEFGPEAEQTKSAAQEADRLIGSLWKGLRETQVPFILVIVSDHGMSKLASDKRIQLSDYIDPETFEIQGSGSFVTLSKKKNSNIKKALESLKKLEPTILVYENKNIPEHYRLRGSPQAGDIVLIAKLPWYIELPNKRKGVQNGSHGWDNNEKDMQGIFFAVGEGVPVGRSLEAFENIHIYKWIADRLGLQIKSKIDGNDSLTKNLSLGNRPGH